jgi:hypothetical protein
MHFHVRDGDKEVTWILSADAHSGGIALKSATPETYATIAKGMLGEELFNHIGRIVV